MSNGQRVLVIGPKTQDSSFMELRESCSKEFGVEIIFIEKLSEIFPLLCEADFPATAIGIDLEYLYEVAGTNLFDEINTAITLLKTQKSYNCDGELVSKIELCSIIGLANLSTNPDIIKEFLKLDEEIAGICPWGAEFTMDEKREAYVDIFNRKFHIPKRIQERIKKEKKSRRQNSIDLTPRQKQILRLVSVKGASNKAIAKTLSISESTVKLHMSAIFKKYGVRNRTQLALFSQKK